jgi:hypothetical protein
MSVGLFKLFDEFRAVADIDESGDECGKGGRPFDKVYPQRSRMRAGQAIKQGD